MVELRATDPDYHALIEPLFVYGAIESETLSCPRLEWTLSAGIATRADGQLRATQTLMVHLDPEDYRVPGRHPDSSLEERLARFGLPPTCSVMRSGYDLYWRLDERLDLRKPDELSWYESTSRRLAMALGGKPSRNAASRMLRPPWTQERDPWLGTVEMEEYWPSRVYRRDAFDLILDQARCRGQG